MVMLGMKPHIKLAETSTPDGKRLTLHVHDGDFSLRIEGRDLMHSSVAASELHLGQLAAERVSGKEPAKVLIGGLGMGFTLKSVLAAAGPNVVVIVAELIPEVVEWNRTHMAGLNGALLNDPRVKIVIENVGSVLGRAKAGEYDAVLLDIDNGPTAMVQAGNAKLYDRRGVARLINALKPGGRAAVWSASVDENFAERMRLAAGNIKPVPARLHANAKRSTYLIYVADKAATPTN